MSSSRIIILSLCFLAACLLIHGKPELAVHQRNRTLGEHLEVIGDWNGVRDIPLAPQITASLELDDYLFRDYSDGKNDLNLYVGYYFSTNKVGATHDPLVCFSGQGWVVDQWEKGSVPIPNATGDAVSYSSMVAERNGERVLVLYWFQAYDSAVADTFSQKLMGMWNAWRHHRMDNALVRVTVPMNGRSEARACEVAGQFIQHFYTGFIHHIRQDSVDLVMQDEPPTARGSSRSADGN